MTPTKSNHPRQIE
jgi:hypothetical protein